MTAKRKSGSQSRATAKPRAAEARAGRSAATRAGTSTATRAGKSTATRGTSSATRGGKSARGGETTSATRGTSNATRAGTPSATRRTSSATRGEKSATRGGGSTAIRAVKSTATRGGTATAIRAGRSTAIRAGRSSAARGATATATRAGKSAATRAGKSAAIRGGTSIATRAGTSAAIRGGKSAAARGGESTAGRAKESTAGRAKESKRATARPATAKPANGATATRATAKPANGASRAARSRAIEVEDDQIVEATLSVGEIETRAANAAGLPPAERLALLAELEEAGFELEGQEMDRAHAAVQLAELALIKEAQEDPAARQAFLAAVRAAPWKGHWIAALGTFGDDESYHLVREMAYRQLEVEYYDTNPAWFFALGALAHRAQFAEDARTFVLGAFEHLAAKSRTATERKLVNAVAFGALAYVAAALPHPFTGPALHHAFRLAAGMGDIKAHYELNVTCGPLAVALASVGYTAAIADIEAFLESFEWRYDGDPFVVQARYALWMLRNDGAGALAYLRDPAHGKSLGLVAAALADLDYKPARDVLAERTLTLTNPVAQEAFAEAIARLDSQFAPPFRDGRMIWMFGRRSPTEQALGDDSDNVFVQRAIARTHDPERGVVYEADDSATAD